MTDTPPPDELPEPDPLAPIEEPFLEPQPLTRIPSTIGGACYLAVLTVAVTGIAMVLVDDWRLGVRVVAGSLGGAAAVRLVLPQRDAGMLAVRHRLTDVLLLAALAGALWFLAGDIPDQPG